MTAPVRVAVLGAGRAGCSLHRALAQAGHDPFVLWTRSPATAAAARAEGFPAQAGPLPDLAGAALVLLATSDSAVNDLSQHLAGRVPAGAVAAHLAGALDLSPLAPLQARGVATGSLHPLASLARRGAPLAGSAAAVAASTPEADALLSRIASDLGLSVIRPRGDRARYHAAACVAGNYPQVLLETAARLLEACGLGRDEARRALGPLLESAARNARELGPAGFTGPVARGDESVVLAHLATFGDGDAGARRLYRAAGALAARLSAENRRGNGDGDAAGAAARLEALLTDL